MAEQWWEDAPVVEEKPASAPGTDDQWWADAPVVKEKPGPSVGDYAIEAGRSTAEMAAQTAGSIMQGAALMQTADPRAVAELEDGIRGIRSMPYGEAEAFRQSIKDRVYAMQLNPIAAINYEAALRAFWKGDEKTASEYLTNAREYARTNAVKDQPLYEAGQYLADSVSKDLPKQDPRFAGSLWSDAFGGLGSMAVLAPAGIGGPGTVAGLGALGTGAEGYEAARRDIENGQYRDDRGGLYNAGLGAEAENVARRAGQASMAPGLSEAAPIELLLDQTIGRLPFFKTPAGATLWQKVKKSLYRTGAQALVEGGQEGFQTWASNVINQLMVDPSQDDYEGVGRSSLVGSIVGGGMQAVAEVGGYRPGKVQERGPAADEETALGGGTEAPPAVVPSAPPSSNVAPDQAQAIAGEAIPSAADRARQVAAQRRAAQQAAQTPPAAQTAAPPAPAAAPGPSTQAAPPRPRTRALFYEEAARELADLDEFQKVTKQVTDELTRRGYTEDQIYQLSWEDAKRAAAGQEAAATSAPADPNADITSNVPSEPATAEPATPERDETFDRAVEMVRKYNAASPGFLAARLQIGDKRARKLLFQLEDAGVLKFENNRFNVVQPVTAESNVPAVEAPAAEAPAAPVPPPDTEFVPEAPETIEAQRAALVAGKKKAVMYSPDTPVPDLPGENVVRGKFKIGDKSVTIDFNPKLTNYGKIQQAIRKNKLNELLDLGPVNKQEVAQSAAAGSPPAAVVERAPDGTEVKAAAGTVETAPEQVQALEETKTAPENTVAVESPQQIINERAASPVRKIDPATLTAEERQRLGLEQPAPAAPAEPAPPAAGPRILEDESPEGKARAKQAKAQQEAIERERLAREQQAAEREQRAEERTGRIDEVKQTAARRGFESIEDEALTRATAGGANLNNAEKNAIATGARIAKEVFDLATSSGNFDLVSDAASLAKLGETVKGVVAVARNRFLEAQKEAKAASKTRELSDKQTRALEIRLSQANYDTVTGHVIWLADAANIARRIANMPSSRKGIVELYNDANDLIQNTDALKNGDDTPLRDRRRAASDAMTESMSSATVDEDPTQASVREEEDAAGRTYETEAETEPTAELNEELATATRTPPPDSTRVRADEPVEEGIDYNVGRAKRAPVVESRKRRTVYKSETSPSGAAARELRNDDVLQEVTFAEAFERSSEAPGNAKNRTIIDGILNRLRKKIGDTPILVVKQSALDEMYPNAKKGNVNGYYDPVRKHIVVSENFVARGDFDASLLAHEGVHAYLQDAIASNEALQKDIQQILDLAKSKAKKEYRGLLDVHEFISEALSSPEFQNFLSQVTVTPEMAAKFQMPAAKGDSNLWRVFVGTVRKYLGVGNNPQEIDALSYAMHLGNIAEQIATERKAITDFEKALARSGFLSEGRSGRGMAAITSAGKDLADGTITEEEYDAIVDREVASLERRSKPAAKSPEYSRRTQSVLSPSAMENIVSMRLDEKYQRLARFQKELIDTLSGKIRDKQPRNFKAPDPSDPNYEAKLERWMAQQDKKAAYQPVSTPGQIEKAIAELGKSIAKDEAQLADIRGGNNRIQKPVTTRLLSEGRQPSRNYKQELIDAGVPEADAAEVAQVIEEEMADPNLAAIEDVDQFMKDLIAELKKPAATAESNEKKAKQSKAEIDTKAKKIIRDTEKSANDLADEAYLKALEAYQPGRVPSRNSETFLNLLMNNQLALLADKFFGRNTNPVRRIADLVEKRRTGKSRYLEQLAPVPEKLLEAERKYSGTKQGRKIWDKFVGLAHDSTMAQVHPDLPLDADAHKHLGKNSMNGKWGKKQHPKLAAVYNALPDDLKALYRETRDILTATQNRIALKLVENVLDAVGHKDAALAQRFLDKTTTKADIDLVGEIVADHIQRVGELAKIQGPYFNLARRGDWVVRGTYKITAPSNARAIEDNVFEFKTQAEAEAFAEQQDLRPRINKAIVDAKTGKTFFTDEDGTEVKASKNDPGAEERFRVTVQNQHVEFFNSEKEAKARREELQKAGLKMKDVEAKRDDFAAPNADMLSRQFRQLAATVGKRKALSGLTDAQRREVKNTLNEISVQFLGSTRIQSHRLPRRFVQGASKDLTLNTFDYVDSASGYLAKLDTQPALEDALRQMEKGIGALSDRGTGLATGARQIAREMTRRVEKIDYDMDAGMVAGVANRLMLVNFVNHLMSPFYTGLQMLQVPMLTLPTLGGEYGLPRASYNILKAYRDVGSIQTVAKGVGATVKAIAAISTPGKTYTDYIKSRLKTGDERRMIDDLVSLGVVDADAGFDVNRLTRKESMIVRGVDASLNYLGEMARAAPQSVEAINRTVTALAAFRMEKAKGASYEKALRAAQEAAELTQFNLSGSNAAPIFKNPVGRLLLQFKKYGHNVYFLLYRNFARAIRPMEKGDRKKGIRSLLYLAATHQAMAGMMGLPLEPLKLAVMALSAFTDYDWDDAEEDVEEFVKKTLGLSDLSIEALMYGLPRLADVNLSSRVGLSNLLVYGEPGDVNNKDSVKAWTLDLLAGPSSGTVTDTISGVNSLMSGDFGRAFEKLIPAKAVSDTIKAYNDLDEGKMNTTDAILRGLGVQSARQARIQEKRSDRFADRRDLKYQKAEIIKDYISATTQGERVKVIARMRQFNLKAGPKDRLSPRMLQNMLRRDRQDYREE